MAQPAKYLILAVQIILKLRECHEIWKKKNINPFRVLFLFAFLFLIT